jgi:Protein of unknown function (DUF2867)
MDMSPEMVPKSTHRGRPWRVHEITRDFRLEDVWVLPTPGAEAGDFPRLVEGLAAGDPAEAPARASRALWALRWKLGEVFGWDDPETGLESRVTSIRDRLPEDLRQASPGTQFEKLPFTSLYQLDDEWAAEVANKTVHGVMHLGWVPDRDGGYRAEMAVYVKPNGLFGAAYMAAIRPFRHLVVYPQMMRQIDSVWRAEKGKAARAS